MFKCLIIKLGAIGDVAMASPMLHALKDKHKKIHFTWVVGKSAAPLLEWTNMVDEIIIADEHAILRGSFFEKICAVFSVQKKLFARKFDLCLIPYRDKRYHLLRLGAYSKETRSFSGKRGIIPGRYHGNEYIRLALGNEKIGSFYPASYFPKARENRGDNKILAPKILLCPGEPDKKSSDWQRQWPLEAYTELANLLCARGYTVGLIGFDNSGEIEKSFSALPVISYLNKTTLLELLQIMSDSNILVSHDAGSLHMMTLVGGYTIALFGPTQAAEKTLTGHCIVMKTDESLACMPCYDGKRYSACGTRECMMGIKPITVYNKLLEIINK